MKNNLTFFLLLAILGVAGCNNKVERPVEGKVKRDVISFTPKVTGRILAIYVEEGQTVQKGDTLAMLDVPEVSAKIAQARGVVKAASAQNQMANKGATDNQALQLKAKISGLTEQYNFAQKSYDRAHAMYKDSMMSAQQHDEIYAKLQGAKAQLQAAQAEYNDVINGVRIETRTATQGQKEQATGVLAEAEIAYSERYIIATNDMEIETITLHEGELATAGYALFNGYIPHSTFFRITIPESKIGQYKKGETVQVKVAYNGRIAEGKIITIKQLARYADITTAYPDYQLEEAIYEIKIRPLVPDSANDIYTNAAIILQ